MWERGPLNYAVGKKGVSITSAKKPYQGMKTSFSIGGTNDDQNDVWSSTKYTSPTTLGWEKDQ